MASETMKLQSKYISMNAREPSSSQGCVVFEETTHKSLGSKPCFYFTVLELMMEICLQEMMEMPAKQLSQHSQHWLLG